jgi:hypothetical protein
MDIWKAKPYDIRAETKQRANAMQQEAHSFANGLIGNKAGLITEDND